MIYLIYVAIDYFDKKLFILKKFYFFLKVVPKNKRISVLCSERKKRV